MLRPSPVLSKPTPGTNCRELAISVVGHYPLCSLLTPEGIEAAHIAGREAYGLALSLGRNYIEANAARHVAKVEAVIAMLEAAQGEEESDPSTWPAWTDADCWVPSEDAPAEGDHSIEDEQWWLEVERQAEEASVPALCGAAPRSRDEMVDRDYDLLYEDRPYCDPHEFCDGFAGHDA